MSVDDTDTHLRQMVGTNKLPAVVYEQLRHDPAAAFQIVQRDKLDSKIDGIAVDVGGMKGDVGDLKTAVQGNPVVGQEGLLPRLARLEKEFFKYKWMVIGGAGTIGFLIERMFGH